MFAQHWARTISAQAIFELGLAMKSMLAISPSTTEYHEIILYTRANRGASGTRRSIRRYCCGTGESESARRGEAKSFFTSMFI